MSDAMEVDDGGPSVVGNVGVNTDASKLQVAVDGNALLTQSLSQDVRIRVAV